MNPDGCWRSIRIWSCLRAPCQCTEPGAAQVVAGCEVYLPICARWLVMKWEEKEFSSQGGFTIMNVLVRKLKGGSVGRRSNPDTLLLASAVFPYDSYTELSMTSLLPVAMYT